MELKLNITHIRHAVPLQALGGRDQVGAPTHAGQNHLLITIRAF